MAEVETAPAEVPVADAPAHEGPNDLSPPTEAHQASVPPAPTPAQRLAAASAIYQAQLEEAAAPDPKAAELRREAERLSKEADLIDGPDRIAARRALAQHRQTLQSRAHPARVMVAQSAAPPPIPPSTPTS